MGEVRPVAEVLEALIVIVSLLEMAEQVAFEFHVNVIDDAYAYFVFEQSVELAWVYLP